MAKDENWTQFTPPTAEERAEIRRRLEEIEVEDSDG